MKLKLLLLMVFASLANSSEIKLDDKKFSLISGGYSYEKKGTKYSSETMYKINHETGETWRMLFDKDHYVWEKITDKK